MIPDDALKRVVTVVTADITDGIAGTGTTLPTTSDTALETPVAATEKDLVISTSGTSFQTTHTIPSTDANGNTLTEWANRMNSDTTLLSRIVTAGITKVAGKEINKITNYNVVRGT